MTVNLSNGAVITIAAGASFGTVDVNAQGDDVYIDAAETSATITSTSGGNFENLVVDATPATTAVADTIDDTTVSLAATGSVAEGGQITYTATVDNATDGDMTVTLNDGTVITIQDGQTSGFTTIDAPADDAHIDAGTVDNFIASTSGGNFENLVNANGDTNPVTTTVTDTADTTNLTLAAEAAEVEGGQITYTATLDNPADTAMTVNLSNGAVITIAAGASFGTVDVNAQGDDVYIDAAETSATITSTSGGNFENLVVDATPATTAVADTIDDTTVSLAATGSVAEGGQITYTATVDNATEGDMTVTLNDGTVITIQDGQTSGFTTIDAPADDAHIDAGTVDNFIASTSGGNFENLVNANDNTNPVTTTVTDTIDTTTLTLNGPGSVIEGEVTTDYTLTLSEPAASDVTVNLTYSGVAADGTDFTGIVSVLILSGNTSNSFNINTLDDSLLEGSESFTVEIDTISGGGFENLIESSINNSVTTTIIDSDYAPTTDDVSGTGFEDDSSISIVLRGDDTDGTVDSFNLSSLPANGTLYTDVGLTNLAETGVSYGASGEALTLYFVPDSNWNGETNFNYSAIDNEGLTDSTAATATITVNAVNDVPVTATNTVTTIEDSSTTITLTATDIDSTVSYFTIDSLPADGTLYSTYLGEGNSGNVLYAAGTDIAASDGTATLTFVPDLNESGSDDYTETGVGDQQADYATFQYTATDSEGGVSEPATITIDVTAVADAPSLEITSDYFNITQEINSGNITATNLGFSVFALNGNNTSGNISIHEATSNQPSGFGVAGTASGDTDEIGYSNGSSEVLDITFDSDVTSVNIEFAWLNSVETASYDFYLDGELVGSGSTDGITDYIDPVVNLKPDTEGQLFDEIRFYSTSSTDDYLIHSISFERQVNTTTPIVVEELSSLSMGFNSALTDTDLSESLSVVLQDIPVGFTISDGIRTFTADADTTSVNVTHWNMSDISIQVSAVDTDTNYTMLLVSTATEVSNGDTAETSQEINITVKDNPDLLFLNNNSAEVYESAMSGGISEASDGEVVSGNILTDDILPDGAALTDVTINGGSTSISGNAITVTTAEGNVLIVNSVTGDYTYTLVNDVNHTNVVIGEVPDSEISEVDTFTENWNTNGSILNGSMNLEQADTASKTFSFGVGHAGQTVTLSYVADISSGYDANGRYQDYFIVRLTAKNFLLQPLVQIRLMNSQLN